MLWFSENKGLATGISIMGFGLAKAIATPVMSWLVDRFGIVQMFVILGAVYFGLMFTAHLILKKPDGWEEAQGVARINPLSMFSDKVYASIWVMFYLNIHCGLMIISYEKQLLNEVFTGWTAVGAIITVIPSLTALFNAAGRIGYSTFSDKMGERVIVYWIIFISSYVSIIMATLTGAVSLKHGVVSAVIITLLLFVINAGYGGGFSTLPALLSERYGMERISQLHGLTLSAWALAGITGNNTTAYILSVAGKYEVVLTVCLGLYILAFAVCIGGVWLKKER
jgi:OFA family oxalate/formate antiporter-like MFS transporter